MALHLIKGKSGEQLAQRHLEQQGLRHLESNYRCRSGEIDLIMRDGDCLVFVEVRYRKDSRFGSACESVTYNKQRKLLASANHYLQRAGGSSPCRFDVVGISGDNSRPTIEWIRDAFQGDR
jgi:putative endonuclease